MAHTFRNTVKKRKATPNEIAKYLLDEAVFNAGTFIDENYGCENLTDKEFNEIERHLNRHIDSIRKRLNVYGDIKTL